MDVVLARLGEDLNPDSTAANLEKRIKREHGPMENFKKKTEGLKHTETKHSTSKLASGPPILGHPLTGPSNVLHVSRNFYFFCRSSSLSLAFVKFLNQRPNTCPSKLLHNSQRLKTPANQPTQPNPAQTKQQTGLLSQHKKQVFTQLPFPLTPPPIKGKKMQKTNKPGPPPVQFSQFASPSPPR